MFAFLSSAFTVDNICTMFEFNSLLLKAYIKTFVEKHRISLWLHWHIWQIVRKLNVSQNLIVTVIGLKIVLISTLFILPCFESKKFKCVPVVCPDCKGWNLDDTYKEHALKHFEGKVVEDGICLIGEKWTFHGNDYGWTGNACCYTTEFAPPSEDIDCSAPDAVQCPPSLLIGFNEKIKDSYKRAQVTLKDAPANGCCPAGELKQVLRASYSQSHDICGCVTRNKIGQAEKSSISSSSSDD